MFWPQNGALSVASSLIGTLAPVCNDCGYWQHKVALAGHGGMARQFKPHDAQRTVKIREGQGKSFNEDMAMLQLQQANIRRCLERKRLMLNIDSGGVH